MKKGIVKSELVKSTNLKGGHTTTDRRLGRIAQFDPRSREFPIRELTGQKPLRSYTWKKNVVLDQGNVGACVGFAWAGLLATRPHANKSITNATGTTLYKLAQTLDDIPGEDYEGTSTLAGARAVMQKGGIVSYHWAFSINDLILALGYAGPVVMGVNWYSGMRATDEQGILRVGGELEGGHDIEASGIELTWLSPVAPKLLANVDKERSFVNWSNSWGQSWGIGGSCKINLLDIERLLSEQGDACVPTGKSFKLAA